jgi:hypothetical protein
MDKKLEKSNGLYTRGHMGGLRSMSLLVGCFYSSPRKRGIRKKATFSFKKACFFSYLYSYSF